MPVQTVHIVSFGYLHRVKKWELPEADITLDLRRHFRDPHVSPKLRHMTADDAPVRSAVLGTPGIATLIAHTVGAVDAYASGPSAGAVTVACGCAGGRHRAPTVAAALADLLKAAGHQVFVWHLDLDRPVIQR
ncbi:RapZ C-terminal domain-containing protein [Streptomyces smyrnaeus]|uniref:RapZ C-terminal domain-containing protein n=1 Tax=Streptomyces smyrnaeus TaxID=1387713 RepID=UPI0033CF52A1